MNLSIIRKIERIEKRLSIGSPLHDTDQFALSLHLLETDPDMIEWMNQILQIRSTYPEDESQIIPIARKIQARINQYRSSFQ